MSDDSDSSSIDSTESPVRYAAYAQRIRTILLSAHRYVAYTSDIGESFRPVAHPWLVRSAYGISWAYLLGDVGHEGYKAYLRNRCALIPPGDAHKDASNVTSEEVIRGMAMGNIRGPLSKEAQVARERDSLTPWPETQISLAEDYRMVMAKRAVFQSIASMGLPAFTIHSVVRYSGRAVKNAKNPLFRTWFPIGVSVFNPDTLSGFFTERENTLFPATPLISFWHYVVLISNHVSSLVSPSCLSSHTCSITLLKKPSTGPLALVFACMVARTQSALSLATHFPPRPLLNSPRVSRPQRSFRGNSIRRKEKRLGNSAGRFIGKNTGRAVLSSAGSPAPVQTSPKRTRSF